MGDIYLMTFKIMDNVVLHLVHGYTNLVNGYNYIRLARMVNELQYPLTKSNISLNTILYFIKQVSPCCPILMSE